MAQPVGDAGGEGVRDVHGLADRGREAARALDDRPREIAGGLVGAAHDTHPATAAAESSLDRDRPSVGLTEGDDLVA